jgi:hypothetical protein
MNGRLLGKIIFEKAESFSAGAPPTRDEAGQFKPHAPLEPAVAERPFAKGT